MKMLAEDLHGIIDPTLVYAFADYRNPDCGEAVPVTMPQKDYGHERSSIRGHGLE
jgi:hypothetical protein